ncbi:MAG: hypothetical protein Sapg2KO_24610 [Saprospiraceae bacterium]
MIKDYCECCGGVYEWGWEDAFNKFGFSDGNGNVNTYVIEEILTDAGYCAEAKGWGIHNVVIFSIKENGKELMPDEKASFTVGYDDPREYLPKRIIELLDKEIKSYQPDDLT